MSSVAVNQTIYFTIATAGHVDHGKTSVLRALTGIDPDRLKEEKLRQMTTDLGFAHLCLAKAQGETDYVVGFIDVPGHGKFLKNMLAGVGGIDMALLVVAADEGPMPQTIAHVKILSLLGVKKTVVVLTKVDLASPQMQEDAVAAIEAMLRAHGVECIGLVRVSCPNQSGFEELKAKLREVLSAGAVQRESAAVKAPAYLPIDRVFNKLGHGVVITGTLVRGTINVGDSLFIEPGGLRAKVRGLETFGNQLQTAQAGQRLAINLSLREHATLVRGQTILGEQQLTCSTLLVQFTINDDHFELDLKRTLSGQEIRLYHGTAECVGGVRWLESMAGGEVLVAQITLSEPVVVEPGERFVVRYGDEGIAGGIVLANARPRWLTRPKLLDLLQALLGNDYKTAIHLLLDACPQRTVRQESVSNFLPREARAEALDRLLEERSLLRLSTHLITRESMDRLSTKLVSEVKKSSAANQSDLVNKHLSLETLRSKILPGVEREVFQALVKELTDAHKVVRRGDRLLVPEAQTNPEKESTRLEIEQRLLSILAEHLCLEIEELAKRVGADKKQITAVLNELEKEEQATVVNYDFACLCSTVTEAHQKLAEIWQRKKEISPADFRDALGTTRKYAMALLAYFDDHGVTRRLAESRVLLKKPKSAIEERRED